MNAIHIGNEIDQATREELTKFIEAVFYQGSKTGMTGKTIRCALGMFTAFMSAQNISIRDCQFTQLPDGSVEEPDGTVEEDCECSSCDQGK